LVQFATSSDLAASDLSSFFSFFFSRFACCASLRALIFSSADSGGASVPSITLVSFA
jgi:hypothetical protein